MITLNGLCFTGNRPPVKNLVTVLRIVEDPTRERRLRHHRLRPGKYYKKMFNQRYRLRSGKFDKNFV
jgi:hypothetical protein